MIRLNNITIAESHQCDTSLCNNKQAIYSPLTFRTISPNKKCIRKCFSEFRRKARKKWWKTNNIVSMTKAYMKMPAHSQFRFIKHRCRLELRAKFSVSVSLDDDAKLNSLNTNTQWEFTIRTTTMETRIKHVANVRDNTREQCLRNE